MTTLMPEYARTEPWIASGLPAANTGAVDTITPLLEVISTRNVGIYDPATPEATADAAARMIAQQAEAAYRQQADSPALLARWAQALWNAGEHGRACDVALQAARLAKKENDVPVTTAAVLVLAAGGQYEQVRDLLSDAPRHQSLALLNAAVLAELDDEPAAQAVLDGVPGASAAGFRGLLLLRQEKYQQAIAELRASSRQYGADPSTAANLAFAYGAVGSGTKAIRSARQAALLAPHRRDLGLGLVFTLIRFGHLDEALVELQRVRDVLGADQEIALTEAGIRWGLEGPESAYRVLKRAMANRLSASSELVATEFQANVVALENVLGRRSMEDTVKALRALVQESERPSVPVVGLLCRLSTSAEVSELLPGVIDRLERSRDVLPSSVLGLRYRLAQAQADFPRAAEFAHDWTAQAPFDPEAAAESILMRALVDDDLPGAVTEARTACRRIPNSNLLANNTAFVLGLAGHGKEAREVLQRDGLDPMVLAATTGLSRLADGDISGGYDLYSAAMGVAGDPGGRFTQTRVALVALYYMYALNALGLLDDAEAQGLVMSAEVPADAARLNSTFALLGQAADRRGYRLRG